PTLLRHRGSASSRERRFSPPDALQRAASRATRKLRSRPRSCPGRQGQPCGGADPTWSSLMELLDFLLDTQASIRDEGAKELVPGEAPVPAEAVFSAHILTHMADQGLP